MFTASQTFINKQNGCSRTYKAKLVVGSTEITEGILSLKYEGCVNDEDTLTLGSTVSNSVEIQIYNPAILLEGKEFTAYIGIDNEYIPLGIFTAQKPQKEDGLYTFTAYDRMFKTEKAYFSSLPATTTTVNALKEIGNKLGFTIATNLSAISIKKIEGLTYREAISYIAQLHGGYATFNRSGQLEIRYFKEISYKVTTDRYFDDLVVQENNFIVNAISCAVGEDSTLKTGSGVTSISISNPYMTQSILNNIYNALKDFTYRPATFSMLGDVLLDAGDIITLEDKNGNVYKIPIMSITHDFDGGVTTTIEAVGKTEEELDIDYKGPSTKNMERYSVELALINKVVANKVDAEYVETEFLKVSNTLSAVNGEFENLKGTVAEFNKATVEKLEAVSGKINDLQVVDLTAIKADIKNLNVDVANIEHVLAGNITAENIQVGAITAGSGIIANGAIGDAQISSLSANKLRAGTIDTSIINVASKDSTINISGNQILINKGTTNRVVLGAYKVGTTTEYGLLVRSADGKTTLIDGNGVHNAGITDGAIDNNKVSDNANIDGTKLNINSVVTEINNGATKLQSTVVNVGNKTLEVYLAEQTQVVNGHTETLTDHATKITANEKAIALKVDTQTYTTDKADMTAKLSKATSDISVLQDKIALKVEKTDIEKAVTETKLYTNQIKNTNLVVNGDGSLGKTTGWINGVQFSSDASNGSYGSFIGQTEKIYITFKNGETYDLSFYLKNKSGNTGVDYFSMIPYDSENNIINWYHVSYVGLTKLTKELKNGDTVIYCENLSGWNIDNANNYNYWRYIGFHDYTNKQGYTYPAGTYTRNIYTGAFSNGSSINKTSNTITLKTAWTGGNKPVGTYIAQHYDGLNYIYFGLVNKIPPTDWTQYSVQSITQKADKRLSYVSAIAFRMLMGKAWISNLVFNRQATTITEVNNKISSAKAEIKLETDKITQSVEKISETVSEKADNSTVKTLSERTANLETGLGGITGRVSSVESTVKTVGDTASSALSKIDGLEIGGRNLVKQSDIYLTETKNDFDFTVLKELRGKTITVSIDIDLVNAIGKRVGFEPALNFADGTCAYFGVWQYIQTSTTLKKRISKTFTVPDKEIVSWRQQGAYIQDLTSGTAQISRPKLEFGNKATDWTPAPEDQEDFATDKANTALNSAKNYTDGKITTVNEKIAEINITTEGITQRVSSTESTVLTHTNQLNTVDNRINTAKNSAISTASNDATTKANNAQTNAVNSAKNYTDGKITTVNQVISNKVAEIKATTDGIASKVEKVEQIATGTQGKMLYIDPTFTTGSNSVKVYNNDKVNGTVTITRVAKSGDCPTTSGYMLEIKTTGTPSPGHGGFTFGTQTRANAVFIVKFIAKIPTGYELRFASNKYGSGGKAEWLTGYKGTGTWTEYIHKLTCGTGSSGDFSNTNYFYLVNGDDPTWYLASATVFDVTDTSNIESRLNTAEQKITDEAIVSTVTKSTTYKDALNGKVSTSSIISCINQTAEAIKISASKINLTGAVTISALATETVNKLNTAYNTANTANSTANSVNSTVTSNKANWDKGLTAYNWTNSYGGRTNSLYSMVTKWTNNAVSTSTYIQGGWIATNTITANKIASNAITSDKIVAGAITASKLNVTSLSAISGNLGTVKVGGSGNGYGILNIYNSSNLLEMQLDYNGARQYSKGVYIGRLGTNLYSSGEKYLSADYDPSTCKGFEVTGYGLSNGLAFRTNMNETVIGSEQLKMYGSIRFKNRGEKTIMWENTYNGNRVGFFGAANYDVHLGMYDWGDVSGTNSGGRIWGYMYGGTFEINRYCKFTAGTNISSTKEIKCDIRLENNTYSALELIRNTDFYRYKLKSDVKDGYGNYENIGVIVEYKTPDIFKSRDKDGINLYTMCSTTMLALKNIDSRTTELEKKVFELEQEVLRLRNLLE